MASVQDVAAYILEKQGPLTAWKLQKLCYYSQAWSLVWDERPLFVDRIEAWANGPVAPALYACHRGEFTVVSLPQGNPANLDSDAKLTVDSVLEFYGGKSAQWLSDLTHREDPWKIARAGIPDGQASDAEITRESMTNYYARISAQYGEG